MIFWILMLAGAFVLGARAGSRGRSSRVALAVVCLVTIVAIGTYRLA